VGEEIARAHVFCVSDIHHILDDCDVVSTLRCGFDFGDDGIGHLLRSNCRGIVGIRL
jgi:hypothetical protein